MTATKTTRILFLTAAEHGEANCQLAVLAALAQRFPAAELHLGSTRDLARRVPAGVRFHEVAGQSLAELTTAGLDGKPEEQLKAMYALATRPGFWGALRGYFKMFKVFHPESPADYLAAARSIEHIITAVEPALVVVDSFFLPAKDAVARLGVKSVILSPNTLKEVAAANIGGAVFTLPATGTGFDYPLTFINRILNTVLLITAKLYVTRIDATYGALMRARHAAGYAGPLAILANKRATVLCMSVPAVEYPMPLPRNIVCCGPILQDSAPVASADPKLAAWLARAPTVLVALGSHWRLSPAEARALDAALRALLDARPDVQVLWKLQAYGALDLGAPHDRLKVTGWLEADPVAILRTGHISVLISHGGSNSYHEALATGVPQVTLSTWYDTHDFGARVEWLGIGKWANRRTAPNIAAPALLAALLDVVGASPSSASAARYAAAARAKQDLALRRTGGAPGTEGRDVAAQYIMDAALKAQ